MNSTEEHLPIDALLPRHLYRLDSRNLLVGVWNPEMSGFIGLRHKFGDEYLFIEYHWDNDSNYGTAKPLYELDEEPVPENVELKTHFGGTCNLHDRYLEFTTPIFKGGQGWVHVDDKSQCAGRSFLYTYAPLFDIVKSAHQKVVATL